ncbi:helix-turn-helix domain-containing protein [Streptomyces sp. NPDC056921]|uniref:helix-turn-helix domain-containing protein n=1 Tax=Streptomyces sp. NPDC056921 TaxID=3345966 RepID=UPI00362771CF
MTPYPGRKLTCPSCRKEFVRQTGKPGRPRDYCSDNCRNQASRRKAAGDDAAPDPARHDDLLLQIADDLLQAMTNLLAGTQNRAASADLLKYRAVIARHWEDYEAVAVRRGRDHGESWEELGAALALSPDRLRKKWTSDAITRRMERRPSHTERPPTMGGTPVFIPRQRPPDIKNTDTPGDADPDADTGPPRPAHSPAQQLASALSHLQRQSGGTLRKLAYSINVDPSYISRIMNGERDPSWRVTEGIARVCAADPADLLPLWNTVHNVATPPPATHEEAADQYRAFLRGLHLSAATPDPDTIREASDNALTTREITHAFHGPGVPDWPTTYHLVRALHGRPADLRPLWQTTRTLPPTLTSTIPADAFG